jgi:hypothetical protein
MEGFTGFFHRAGGNQGGIGALIGLLLLTISIWECGKGKGGLGTLGKLSVQVDGGYAHDPEQT